MPSPMIVLLHGAGLDSRSWSRVAAALAPLPVVVPDLPGRGADRTPLGELTYEGCVTAVAQSIPPDGEVVLVAHSLASVLLGPLLARLGERVVKVVVVAGCLPPPGSAVLDVVPAPLRPAARWFYGRRSSLSMSPAVARVAMGNGLSADDRRLLVSLLTPEATALQRAPMPAAPWPSVPATWVLTRRDRMFAPRLQRRSIASATVPMDVVELDAGHLPLLSHPEELVALISSR